MGPRLAFVGPLLACSACILAGSPVFADSVSFSAKPIVPRETKVLLLQPIDATVDSAALHPLRQKIIRLRQQYEFIGRQFAVLGEGIAAKAASRPPRLDLEGESGRSAENMDEIARRADADWSVSVTVLEIKTDPSGGMGFNVHSIVLIRIRDARRHVWLAERPYVGRVAGVGAPGRLFIASLRAATGEALAAVLVAYPRVVRISQDGSIVDYLAGQSAAFIGDPATPFLGLNAAQVVRPQGGRD
jgi:hypothetical protein